MLKNVRFIVIFVIIIFLISAGSYYSGINSSVDKKGEDVQFLISGGESVEQIRENLSEAGLIKSKFYFKVYVLRNRLQVKFQAGQYVLNPRLAIKEIIEILTSGEALSKERTIKIIEGWSLRDIGYYFENEGMFQPEELSEIAGSPMVDYRIKRNIGLPKDYSDQFSFLADKPKYYGLEGYLFPDTYRIFNDSTVDDIIIKMLSNLDNKLTLEMREDIKKQGKSIFDIITMASLLEKEGQTEKDLKIISGIFWNRINEGMPLQSDATLSYIYGDKKAAHSIEETKVDSSYNSYLILGLPPGPISNPGIKAIKAAIYPEDTDYLFFLHRQKDGKTFFSKTYEGHLKNKAKYLQ